jgi:hypothetical protein
VNADAFMKAVGSRFATRGVRGDDQDFVTVMAEMLHHPKHRVGDAVDIREEGFCDDRNAHTGMLTSAAVGKVAYWDTGREVLVPIGPNTMARLRVSCA